MKERLIRINGLLYKITKEGRFRRNWKTEIRSRDSRKYRTVGKCLICGTEQKLTVDHHPPLRETTNNNTQMICWECHKAKNRIESQKLNNVAPKFIQNCGKGHHTFLLDDLSVWCKECNKKLNQLKLIASDEYETVEV